MYHANVYFTSDVDAKNRIRSLNELSKINLNEIRRTSMHDDGVFNDYQFSDQEFNDEIASISIDSQTSMMDHNETYVTQLNNNNNRILYSYLHS